MLFHFLVIDPITGAAVVAGATALGSAISGLFGSHSQKKAQDANAKENALARQHDFDVMDYVNEYNHPKKQMERLREAQLNPNLAYGSLQSSLATPVNSGASGALGASDANAFSGLGNVGSALGSQLFNQQNANTQEKVGNATSDNLDSQTDLNEKKSVAQDLENKKNEALYGDEHWLNAMKKLPKAELEVLTSQKDINLKTIDEIISRTQLNDANKALAMNSAHKAWEEYKYQKLYNTFAPDLLRIQRTQGEWSLVTAKQNLAVLVAQAGMYSAMGEQAHAYAEKALEEKKGVTIDNMYKPAQNKMQWRLNRSLLNLNEARTSLNNTLQTLADLGIEEKKLNIYVKQATLPAQVVQPYLDDISSLVGIGGQLMDNNLKPVQTGLSVLNGLGGSLTPAKSVTGFR